MNANERLGLIERVNHASEDQAKLTLKFMILKCTVTQNTIARAIREAIERHTPTPTIVYQQPEPVDDDEVALTSSHRKSQKKKKKDHDGGGQDEVDESSTVSTRRGSTRRGDINADRLVEKLILKKSKRNKKHSSDHDEEENSPDASKKNKPKHIRKPRDETEQPAHENSMGQPSKQKQPTVIDLVTSSEDETYGNLQSDNESLDQSSDNDASDNESSDDSPDDDSGAKDSSDGKSSEDASSEDDSSDIVSSDGKGTGNVEQGDAIAGASDPSEDECNKSTAQASARGGDGGHDAARTITVSMAKTPIQNDDIKRRPFDLTKKRKAPEQTVEVHKDHAIQTATETHVNKRSKPNHRQELQKTPGDRTCRVCDVIFPSVAQLLKHRIYCKDSTSPLGSHYRSEPPMDHNASKVEQSQVARNPAGDSLTDEPHNILQLPSRPHQGAPADRGLSVPPPSFVHEPNNDPRGPTPIPMALARSVSGIQPSPAGLVHHTVPKFPSDVSRLHPFQLPKPTTHEQDRDDWARVLHRCKHCNKWFRHCDNTRGACCRHPGQYGPLQKKHLVPGNFKGGIVPPLPIVAWTCCRQQDKDAPPCKLGRHTL